MPPRYKIGCKFTLLCGLNKGKPCNCSTVRNSGYCSRHMKMVKIPSINDLPSDIILYMTKFMDSISIYQFSLITPYVETVFSGTYSDKIWADTISKSGILQNYHVRKGLSPQRMLELVTNRGCEACGKSRIRKVYWPFGMRLCRECLEQLTISDYRLINNYNISKDKLRRLYNIKATLWNKYHGYYDLTFYLRSDVEQKLQKTLQEIYDEKRAIENAETKRRHDLINEAANRLKSEYPNKTRLSRCKTYSDICREIMKGQYQSIDQIITNNFMLDLRSQYDRLFERDKETTKLYREKYKRFNELKLHFEECKTSSDYSELLHRVEQCEISSNSWYDLKNEIEIAIGRLKVAELLRLHPNPDLAQIKEWLISNEAMLGKSSVKIFRCRICNNDRLFCLNGLRQHSSDKHRCDYSLVIEDMEAINKALKTLNESS
jgi:hypothetical protein